MSKYSLADWAPATAAFEPGPDYGSFPAALFARVQPADSKAPAPPAQQSLLPGSYITAPLSDSNGVATGLGSYQTTTTPYVSSVVFRVTANGLTANSTFSVAVDGLVVGQLTTDGSGSGTLVLSSASDSPTLGEGAVISHHPPEVHEGSIVSVGPLSGTFGVDPHTQSFGGAGSRSSLPPSTRSG